MTSLVIRFKTSPATSGLSFTNSSAFYQQIELKTVMKLPKEKAIYTLNELLTNDKQLEESCDQSESEIEVSDDSDNYFSDNNYTGTVNSTSSDGSLNN